ncbi:hypothetical protein BGX38DRAFT_1174297 [Terfezia claveryi]|nr:hypothetical protein BGX38DRAFT_1174297 [Terfezia claveryi]
MHICMYVYTHTYVLRYHHVIYRQITLITKNACFPKSTKPTPSYHRGGKSKFMMMEMVHIYRSIY